MISTIRDRLLALGGVCCLALVVAGPARGGDWPQILGPERSGKATGEKLAPTWPAGGPIRLWNFKLGSGYAGPAVAGERVIVFHRVGGSELVEAIDAASGKPVWKASYVASYRSAIDRDDGPRCVPLVADKQVYVFGPAGDLRCLALANGDQVWERNLYDDYAGDEGYFGAGSTPIIVAGKLLVNVGGKEAGLVALDPATGKTIWKATSEAASYSSPTTVKLGGKEQVVFVTRYNCVLADPTTGKVQTLFSFGMRGPTVNAATPLALGGKLFVTASYGVGARLAPLDVTATKPLWANDNTLSSQYATPVEHNGFLYGTHGREDMGVAELRCIEAVSGKVRWSKQGFGVANLILAGDKLLIVGAGGRLRLANANPAKYEELAAHELAGEVSRALPALSGGRLYVRTGSGGGQLHCFKVGP